MVTLPCPIANQAGRLADLLSAGRAATFGRGQEAVLDETYRKTLQCDTSR